MKRGEFITLAGGAAAAWPMMAQAQQRERTRLIGVLNALAADDPQSQRRMTAFLRGLQQFGWTDGRNIRVDYRWGAGDSDNIRKYAAELVALAPDVILASGTASVAPVLAQISTGLRKASDFRGPPVPSRHGEQFSPPLFRSSPSVFAAAAISLSSSEAARERLEIGAALALVSVCSISSAVRIQYAY